MTQVSFGLETCKLTSYTHSLSMAGKGTHLPTCTPMCLFILHIVDLETNKGLTSNFGLVFFSFSRFLLSKCMWKMFRNLSSCRWIPMGSSMYPEKVVILKGPVWSRGTLLSESSCLILSISPKKVASTWISWHITLFVEHEFSQG